MPYVTININLYLYFLALLIERSHANLAEKGVKKRNDNERINFSIDFSMRDYHGA